VLDHSLLDVRVPEELRLVLSADMVSDGKHSNEAAFLSFQTRKLVELSARLFDLFFSG
jgi:hypothetical protein